MAGLWLAGLVLAVPPLPAAADGAALHAVADGHLYHVASDTATTTLAAQLDVAIESMTTINGTLHAASSGRLPALYQVATDGVTSLKGPFDHSSSRSISGLRGLERIGTDLLAVNAFESSFGLAEH